MNDIADLRARRKAILTVDGRAVKRARLMYEAAVATRDGHLKEFHGDKRHGFLSYQELADAADMSKGRVIQVVNPPDPDDGE